MRLSSGMYHLLCTKYPVNGKRHIEQKHKNQKAIKFSFGFVCFCRRVLESERQKTCEL